MASLSDVESVVNYIAKNLNTSVKTKFTNTDTGYAAANGSFENNTRFSVLNVDETKTMVCNLATSSGNYVELSVNRNYSNQLIGDKAARAYAVIS
jgi:hypothetical protein